MSDIREQLEQLGLGQTRMLRPYLRPVHRGLQHRQPEASEGAVGQAELGGLIGTALRTAMGQNRSNTGQANHVRYRRKPT